mgnify:CR=1 FL=1
MADLLGDVVFVCTDAVDNHTDIDNYRYITHYKLEVVTKWGQYEVSTHTYTHTQTHTQTHTRARTTRTWRSSPRLCTC